MIINNDPFNLKLCIRYLSTKNIYIFFTDYCNIDPNLTLNNILIKNIKHYSTNDNYNDIVEYYKELSTNTSISTNIST